MIEYKIITQKSFDWVIVTYFFLGGLSAGSYFLSVAANFWKKDLKPLAKQAVFLSLAALAAGMALLLADLGQPLRFPGIMVHFNPTSALSWGVWFLNIFIVLNVVYAWFLLKGDDSKAKKVAYPGLVFAVLVSSYTGVLLAQAPGRALWHSALVPVLFLLGGIISGCAINLLLSPGKISEEASRFLRKLVGWLVVGELALVALELIVLRLGGADEVHAAHVLLTGQFSLLFWTVEVALGAIIPILILFKEKVTPAAVALASLFVLIGIFAMRYIIVYGGQVLS